MNAIKENELYQNLSEFLKAKGVELKEGTYTARIRQSCSLLTDAINCTERGLKEAKTQVDRKLDEVRQVIHDKTAPRPPAGQSARAGAKGKPRTAAKSKPRKAAAKKSPRSKPAA